jgi:adenosine deaminase CECR1
VFKIAQEMPKGMHLHLHFNAELDSRQLIAKAGELPHNMFIRSTQPLLSDKDYAETELVFNVMPANTPTVDCFSPEYQPAWRTPEARPWMRWTDFREELKKRRPKLDAETWIRDKMVLNQEEVYGISQTVNG